MKRSIAIIAAALFAFAGSAAGQRQTFNLPAYFTTNVYLQDDTNSALSARISAIESTGAVTWSQSPATQTVDFGGYGATNIGFVGFDTAYTNGIAEGRLQWNTDAEKLEYGLVDGGLTLKIGDANVMRVKASENILKGQVVSASGQTGNARPNAILSDADSTNLTRRVPTGIALQDINQNQSGYIVTAGLADGMNTTGFPADVPLFLSTTPGALTTNKPAYPYDGWYVAESVLSNATEGQMVVNIVPCKRWEDLDGRYATTSQLFAVSNAISTASAAAWSSFAATQVVDFADNVVTGATFIYGAANTLDLENGEMTGGFTFNDAVTLDDDAAVRGRFVVGNGALTNIAANAVGAFQAASISGIATIGDGARGASQQGDISGTATIGQLAYGASQQGRISGTANIGTAALGAMQIGYLPSGSTANNNGAGAIQLMGDTAGSYLTTGAAEGSILLGPGTNSVAYSVKAAGGFYGNAAGLTNFPSSLLRVSAANANYYRITTAPTGATAYGESGQIAVTGTNIYIYSANALGTGTGRWLRVQGDASW